MLIGEVRKEGRRKEEMHIPLNCVLARRRWGLPQSQSETDLFPCDLRSFCSCLIEYCASNDERHAKPSEHDLADGQRAALDLAATPQFAVTYATRALD